MHGQKKLSIEHLGFSGTLKPRDSCNTRGLEPSTLKSATRAWLLTARGKQTPSWSLSVPDGAQA